jgi:DbpA RNA binding domain
VSLPEQEDATQPISGDIAAAFAEALRETIQNQNQTAPTNEEDEESEGEEAEGQDGAKMTRLYLNLGRRDHVRASEVTRFLREHVKLTRRDLGRVQVRDTFSHVGIRLDLAEQLLKSLQGQKFRNKEVVVELAKHNPNRNRNNAPHHPQDDKNNGAAPEVTHMGLNIEQEAAIPEITLQPVAVEAVAEAAIPEAASEAQPQEAQPTEATIATPPQDETPNQ